MIQEMWQRLLRNKILFAALNIILGIYMVIARRSVLNVVIRVIGFALLMTAIAYLLMYFLGHRRDQIQLYYAGISGVAGLLVLWLIPSLVRLFPVLAGIALIVIGISNLTSVAKGGPFPAYSKAGPIVTIVLGAILLFRPGTALNLAVALAGIALILNGLSELDLIRRFW